MMKLNATTCMMPPFDTNPSIKMWCLVTTFWILALNFLEYVKLAKLVIAQIEGNVQDDMFFFYFGFHEVKTLQ
jgi:hypothetical protein